jgi:putative restriction endonuclease
MDSQPRGFARNIVQCGTYRLDDPSGRHLWRQVAERLAVLRPRVASPGPALVAAAESARFGTPILVQPRLGQGSFRALVTDAHGRRCAMTGERTLPVLEAAHIRSYSDGGPHELSNGLLLRSDLHRLFDDGYIIVEPVENGLL